jgi:hypothetical protein
MVHIVETNNFLHFSIFNKGVSVLRLKVILVTNIIYYLCPFSSRGSGRSPCFPNLSTGPGHRSLLLHSLSTCRPSAAKIGRERERGEGQKSSLLACKGCSVGVGWCPRCQTKLRNSIDEKAVVGWTLGFDIRTIFDLLHILYWKKFKLNLEFVEALVPSDYLEPVIAHRPHTVILSGSSPWSLPASHPEMVLHPAERIGRPQTVDNKKCLQEYFP